MKMEYPQVKEHNATTGEIIMREMTEGEKANYSFETVEPTIEEKLSSVGLSVADLKTALGL
jgi:hypothetical protein